VAYATNKKTNDSVAITPSATIGAGVPDTGLGHVI
jgi:hypothetical protein